MNIPAMLSFSQIFAYALVSLLICTVLSALAVRILLEQRR
jgi:hypothetical protein